MKVAFGAIVLASSAVSGATAASVLPTVYQENDEGSLRSSRKLALQVPGAKHYFSLKDPQTVQEKFVIPEGFVTSDQNWKSAVAPEDLKRPLNILSFGTSQTWGHGLNNRHTAYPYIITDPMHAEHHVDNLALPATAADHPSICLQSMIPDAETKNYDLITIEYPSNQSDGVTLLIRRLRERYPGAIIVFVNVWSMVARARFQKQNPRQYDGGKMDPNIAWEWAEGDPFSVSPDPTTTCAREICHKSEIEALMAEVHGLYYTMDTDVSPQQVLDDHWFTSDWHHLSEEGHKYVAEGIVSTLRQNKDTWEQLFSDYKPLGSWALGDKCFNWYYSGQTNGISYKKEDAELVCVKGTWCSLNILNPEGAEITFESDYNGAVPVALGYMTRGSPKNFYADATVKLNHDPSKPDGQIIRGHVDRTTRTAPKSVAKVTSYFLLGAALPGSNTITIKPRPKVDGEAPENPFAVVGIYLCGACMQFQNGHMGIGALNFDNHSDETPQPFDKERIKEQMGWKSPTPILP